MSNRPDQVNMDILVLFYYVYIIIDTLTTYVPNRIETLHICIKIIVIQYFEIINIY